MTEEREFVRMVARLDHTGDDGFTWPDDGNDGQWALDSLIAKARGMLDGRPASKAAAQVEREGSREDL